MSLKNKIATSNSILTVPLKYFFYKYKNKYYEANELIESAKIDDDIITLTLKDGTILKDLASDKPAEIQFTDRIKYGCTKKMDKILDVNRFFFIYEIISELFVNTVHYKYFDIKEGDIVVDAGANIGGFTVQAAKKVGKNGRVIAFEPNERNMKVLQMNCKANNLNNVIFCNKGLWSKKETLEFFESHRKGEHSLIHNDEQHDKFQLKSTKIEVDTLDNLLKELNIKQVDFLKMDIEGAEFYAMTGATDSILKNENVKIIIEIHLAEGEMTDKKIIPLLNEYKFEILESGSNYRMPVFAKKSK